MTSIKLPKNMDNLKPNQEEQAMDPQLEVVNSSFQEWNKVKAKKEEVLKAKRIEIVNIQACEMIRDSLEVHNTTQHRPRKV